MRSGAHFWTLEDAPGDWDPDLEPARFLSGYGHAFVELFVRLKARGLPVTIGSWPARGTRVMLASLEELTRWQHHLAPSPAARLALAALRCPTVILVRGDLPLEIAAPRYVRTEIMPTQQSVALPDRQLALPLLPQRGLIRRRPERGELIRYVAIKAFRHTIPEFLLEPSFARRLRGIDVELRVDTETDTPLRWHDFSEVDVVLCVRRFVPPFDTDKAYLRRPATKLINAWSAGAIPIVAPEAAYLELIEPGKDALIAGGAEEIVETVQELRRNPELVRRLLCHGEARAVNFTVDAVLDRWQQLLESELPAGSRLAAAVSAVAYGRLAVADRLRRRRRS